MPEHWNPPWEPSDSRGCQALGNTDCRDPRAKGKYREDKISHYFQLPPRKGRCCTLAEFRRGGHKAPALAQRFSRGAASSSPISHWIHAAIPWEVIQPQVFSECTVKNLSVFLTNTKSLARPFSAPWNYWGWKSPPRPWSQTVPPALPSPEQIPVPKQRENRKGSSSPAIKLFNLMNCELKVWPKIFHFFDREDKNNSSFSVHVFSPIPALANLFPFSPSTSLERPRPEKPGWSLFCLAWNQHVGGRNSNCKPRSKIPSFSDPVPTETSPDNSKAEHWKWRAVFGLQIFNYQSVSWAWRNIHGVSPCVLGQGFTDNGLGTLGWDFISPFVFPLVL